MGSGPLDPKQPSEGVEHPSGWTPRPQQPSASYTSLRRFRDAIAAERLTATNEQAAVTPEALGIDDVPLPGPGTPLFGEHGLMSRPVKPLPHQLQHLDAAPLPPFTIGDVLPVPATKTKPASVSKPGTKPVPVPKPATKQGAVPATKPVPVSAMMPVIPPPQVYTAANIMILPGASEGPRVVSRRPRLIGFRSFGRPSPYQMRAISGVVAIIVLLALIAHPLINAFAAKSGKPPRPPASYTLKSFQPGPIYLPAQLDVDHPPPVVWAESAFVMDETNGAVLYAKNPNEELPMASTTKLMTAVVALAHASPDKVITITADATNTDGTSLGLIPGEKYTLRELLTGMLMISGNDAAEAVADGVAGNATTFVKWMNDTGASLGLTHTHFMNPHGLDDDKHYSSAHDLGVLGSYALSLPTIHAISRTQTASIPATKSHAQHDLKNLHEPLWWYPGADGGKPGWTGAARFVDILSAERDGRHLIAVLMHGQNDWVTDIRDLLNWGFNDFSWVSPREIDQQHWIPFDDSYGYFKWDVPSRTVTVGDRTYFPYTGFTVAGTFQTYFNQQHGIDGLGFPIGMPLPAADGQLTQQFEKATVTCDLTSGKCHV